MSGMPSAKRVLIDKANSTVVIVVSIAAFLTVFSAVATKAFISQAAYQNRLIDSKRKALTQLQNDLKAVDQLKTSYYDFTGRPQNAIGGNPLGADTKDGTNAKIVLDALPSKYDFPALTTSLEYLLSTQGVKINSISGTDDEVAQGSNESSPTPEPIAMPFQLSVTGDYDRIKGVIDVFEKSIRPIQLKKIDVSGRQDNISLSIDAQTYYQPAKSLNITMKVQK
ncbi:hypothetical protein JNM87_00890 [Candidatus Saccharibacteria bacterium]|nr:hypothetical protein [Candidatus Saccharibacteria bacterium]